MIYLKEYNNYDNRLFKEVDVSNFIEYDMHNHNTKDYKRVIPLLIKYFNCVRNPSDVNNTKTLNIEYPYFEVRNNDLFVDIPDLKFFLKIKSYEDEWYTVMFVKQLSLQSTNTFGIYSSNNRYYICDGDDGLQNCILRLPIDI